MRWPKAPTLVKVLVIAGLVLAAGLFIAQDQETLRIKSPVAASDPGFPGYLADLLGHQLTSNDSYIVHTNGNRAYPAMLAAIAGAKSSISLETYIYAPDRAGSRFANALATAARRGVRVQLVLDAVGASSMSHTDIERIERAGGKIGWVNPVSFAALETMNFRTHRKALVVDGEVAFVGGMGVADHWAENTKDGRRWRDTQIELHGPVVAHVQAGFSQNWMATGGVVAPDVRVVGGSRTAAGQSIVVWSRPRGGANEMKLLFLLAIASARHTLDIQSPYLITDASSKWSLQQARQRGVVVRLLTEGDVTDAMSVKHAGRHDYEHLLERGITVAEYQPAMMHTKVMIVDGLLSIVGSANFDNRSLELNDELNVAIFDRDLAARLTADFERDLAQSTRLALDTWRDRPYHQRLLDWLWSYFGEVF